jgi:hypothetical protein
MLSIVRADARLSSLASARPPWLSRIALTGSCRRGWRGRRSGRIRLCCRHPQRQLRRRHGCHERVIFRRPRRFQQHSVTEVLAAGDVCCM